MDTRSKSNIPSPDALRRGFLLAVLLLLAAAFGKGTPAATPIPQVFDTPARQISTYTTLTILAKDDPAQAHWYDYFGGSVDVDGDG